MGVLLLLFFLQIAKFAAASTTYVGKELSGSVAFNATEVMVNKRKTLVFLRTTQDFGQRGPLRPGLLRRPQVLPHPLQHHRLRPDRPNVQDGIPEGLGDRGRPGRSGSHKGWVD